jgi:hypothetical protein
MILSDAQWRALKAIRWDRTRSRRIQQLTHDDKLTVGFCARRKCWVVGRIIDVTVMTRFGVQTIPTREKAPYVWKVWETDEGVPLSIDDPRLVPYIQRCDLWRMGAGKYLLQYDKEEWLEGQRDKSEEDDLGYMAKEMYGLVKKDLDRAAGYMPARNIPQKHFFQSNYSM